MKALHWRLIGWIALAITSIAIAVSLIVVLMFNFVDTYIAPEAITFDAMSYEADKYDVCPGDVIAFTPEISINPPPQRSVGIFTVSDWINPTDGGRFSRLKDGSPSAVDVTPLRVWAQSTVFTETIRVPVPDLIAGVHQRQVAAGVDNERLSSFTVEVNVLPESECE